MKNIAYLLFGLLLFSNGSFAQLKHVKYKDGTQVLSGFEIHPTKKSAQKSSILNLPAWKVVDKHAKDNAEAGQKAGYYKTNIAEYQKRIALALEQLIKSGANPDNVVAHAVT